VTARDANDIEYYLYELDGKQFYFNPASNGKLTLAEFDAMLQSQCKSLKRTVAPMDANQQIHMEQIMKHGSENKKLCVEREVKQEQVRISHRVIQVQKEAAQSIRETG